MSKERIRAVLVGTFLITCVGCFLAKEIGIQFYFAKGLTVNETITRFGKPLWTHGDEENNDLYLYYYTEILNTAVLKVDKGRVVDVEMHVAD